LRALERAKPGFVFSFAFFSDIDESLTIIAMLCVNVRMSGREHCSAG
jgi:hypothetical protein